MIHMGHVSRINLPKTIHFGIPVRNLMQTQDSLTWAPDGMTHVWAGTTGLTLWELYRRRLMVLIDMPMLITIRTAILIRMVSLHLSLL